MYGIGRKSHISNATCSTSFVCDGSQMSPTSVISVTTDLGLGMCSSPTSNQSKKPSTQYTMEPPKEISSSFSFCLFLWLIDFCFLFMVAVADILHSFLAFKFAFPFCCVYKGVNIGKIYINWLHWLSNKLSLTLYSNLELFELQ